MIIVFCGNHDFAATSTIESRLLSILNSYAETMDTLWCYCGGYGNFDSFAARCVNKIKANFDNVKCCLITAYMLPVEKHKTEYLNSVYDEIIYPPLENVPPRFAILKRNEWMTDQADIIISYVKYTFGGAAKMLRYAERKNKKILALNEVAPQT